MGPKTKGFLGRMGFEKGRARRLEEERKREGAAAVLRGW
jgi:hypothetical protein